MNILITGAAGFIGKSYSDKFKYKYNVVKIDSRYDEKNTNNIVINLLNKEEIDRKITEINLKIDVILHLASKFITSNKYNIDVLYDNLKITENIIYLCKKLVPLKLINFSSIAVYPGIDGNFSEDSIIQPSKNTECLYGLSKFCSENLFDFYLKENNITVTNLRVAQVFGEGMREDRIMSIMIKELKGKNTITLFGDGERISNFISIDRLLYTIDFFIEKDIKGIYNIGEKNMSYKEMAIEIIKKYGDNNSKLIFMEKGNKSKFFLDINKLKSIIK